MEVQDKLKEKRLDLVIQVRWVIMEYIVISMTWILRYTFWNETYITQPQGQPAQVKYSGFMSALHIPIVDTACNLEHLMSKLPFPSFCCYTEGVWFMY